MRCAPHAHPKASSVQRGFDHTAWQRMNAPALVTPCTPGVCYTCSWLVNCQPDTCGHLPDVLLMARSS
eukprot:365520-Chlamydomonas_euryale.AAC.15